MPGTANTRTEIPRLQRTCLLTGEMTATTPGHTGDGQVLDGDALTGLISMEAKLRPLPSPLSISATGQLTAFPGAALSPSCGRLDRSPALPLVHPCPRLGAGHSHFDCFAENHLADEIPPRQE